MFDIEFRETRWRILIADDSMIAARALEAAVAQFFLPIDIVQVSTGQRCLEELATNSYDIAFVDLVFPDISGLEAIAAARASGSRTFVTVVSGYCTPDHVELAKALKAYDFLTKPVRTEDVMRILDCYAQASQRRRMLLIDDSGTARRLIRKIVGRSLFRFDVTEAEDPITGFEIFVRERPDIVMIDVNMGSLDGISASRIFRAHMPGSRIVLVSADREALTGSGMLHTLVKPFDYEELDCVLHDLMGLGLPYFSDQDRALRTAALSA